MFDLNPSNDSDSNLALRYIHIFVCVLQAAARQLSLEQRLGSLRENETALHTLQTSLTQLDQTLTSYLTDRIDAFQLPQEAQV